MFRKKLHLKSFLYISCLCISILPILLYILISMFIYGRGLDTVNKASLVKALLDFHEKQTIPPDNIKVLNGRSLIPSSLNLLLPVRLEDGRLYRSAIESDKREVESVFLLVSQQIGNNDYIAYQLIPKSEADIFIKPEVTRTLWILTGSSIIMLGSLIILIRAIIHKVEAPISRLENWANNISSENIAQPLPNLIYPELYNITRLIKSKFIDENERIKSEEQFWKFCSHELRTPISITRVGIDLLQRYIEKGERDTDTLNPVILKLKKSSHTLSHMIETILWINRDNSMLSTQEVDLSCLINDIIKDFKSIYLIDSCNINIYTHPYVIRQPDLALRIVLENLIRNAFQHSIGEEINIIQSCGTVKIINKLMPSHLDSANTGFGLGRELIARLTDKLGWELRVLSNDSYHIAIVRFT